MGSLCGWLCALGGRWNYGAGGLFSNLFFSRCAIMPRSLVCAREKSLSSRVFAVHVTCRRAVLLVAGVLWPFRFLVVAMEGRTLASAVAMSDAVSLRGLPAGPMGMQMRSTHPQYRRGVATKGMYFSAFFLALCGSLGP